MLGNLVEQTSATGGSGALTLQGVVGAPTFRNVWGSTGTRKLQYSLVEYDTPNRGSLVRAEAGIGEIDLSTNILTRQKILSTWDGAAYTKLAPTALSFGSDVNLIRLYNGPLAEIHGATIPFFSQTGDNMGLLGGNMPLGNGGNTVVMASGVIQYVPYLWLGCGTIDRFGIVVSTAVASTSVQLGVYELGTDGNPGQLLKDLTAGTGLDSTTTGVKTGTTSLWLPPGWCYVGVLANGAPTLQAPAAQPLSSPLDFSSASPNCVATKSGISVGAGSWMPSPANTSLTYSTSLGPCVYLRPANA